MDQITLDSGDPRDEIARLEDQIEQLAGKLESCRKFMLASRVAIALGGVLLLTGLIGVIRFDATSLSAAFAAVLGGIVVSGSNSSTAKEVAAQLAAAEKDRATLIGMIELRVVDGRDTVH